jgi:hypothetical protein
MEEAVSWGVLKRQFFMVGITKEKTVEVHVGFIYNDRKHEVEMEQVTRP